MGIPPVSQKKKGNKSGGMEVVLLIEGVSACGQCERRSIAIIRHTETGLDVFDRAAICEVTVSTAREAVDQEVLSAKSVKRIGINWKKRERENREGDALPGEFNGLEAEVAVSETLHLN
jgi:hypothetical protein